MLYLLWRLCERWGIYPSGVKANLAEIENFDLALLIGYEQIRQLEETVDESLFPKVKKR